jgi:hypothetical protein
LSRDVDAEVSHLSKADKLFAQALERDPQNLNALNAWPTSTTTRMTTTAPSRSAC